MALIKQKTTNEGTVGEYWVAEPIIDKLTNKTKIKLYLFKDKDARINGKHFMLKTSALEMDGTYHNGSDVYTHITASRMVEQKNEETGEKEMVESNFFVDAVGDE